jgi:two-component system cell cycle sensor histidine kinase/response regulator CckA
MNIRLRILHLEDDERDAELARETLQAEGIACDVVRVETSMDFVAALQRGDFDIILADYKLPAFDGFSALAMVKEQCPDVPFIFVTGSMGEETAIDSLKRGATDYVLKDRLSRLVPAVQRALREAEEVAERKRLEAQFLQAQKMEAVGRLAGGVAHDFNNLLTAILGYADLAMSTLSPDAPVYKDIQEIQNAAQRASGLTRQLLAFSRRQIIAPRVIDLNELVLTLDNMLRRLIGEDIELRMLLAQDLGAVKVDPGQVEQVILNLVVNARDAMPRGGKLTIETGSVTLDDDYMRVHPEATSGDYVMVAMSDTGVGMTEEVKSHLFEPFFTTKEMGKGTGLGLATVYGIVKQSGGFIYVYSEPGKGTTFKIYLPRVKEPVTALPRAEEFRELPRGTETVLLVEDEPSVRELAARALRQQGYTVLEAASGKEALQLSKEYGEKEIHLLFTDVVLPQMSGKRLAERLKELRPQVKVLFTSGYADNAVVQHQVLEPGVEFLAKPFSPAVLARKVRQILDAP